MNYVDTKLGSYISIIVFIVERIYIVFNVCAVYIYVRRWYKKKRKGIGCVGIDSGQKYLYLYGLANFIYALGRIWYYVGGLSLTGAVYRGGCVNNCVELIWCY